MAEQSQGDSLTRLYLDHAATSWPKLPSATAAAIEFIEQCGAASGRGAYRSAQVADRWVAEARRSLAKLIHAPTSDCIALCNSGTHALNAALYGLLREGDHVVTTAMEHNSVLRPLARMASDGLIALTIVPCDVHGKTEMELVEQSIRGDTRWLVVGHASNVTGAVQDIEGLGQLARSHQVGFVVDASQTVGYLPIDVGAMAIDALAAAGHKGLRAWAGTGFLYVSAKLQSDVRPLMRGGTGTSSEVVDGNPDWPQSVEVGNLNLPGIVTMAVAAGEADLSQRWRWLYAKLIDGLLAIPGLQVLSSARIETAIPVVSVRLEGWDNHDLASVLDVNFGIEVRAGLHCAGLVHQFTNSQASGGTLRLSLGHSSTEADVARVLDALRSIANATGN